MKLNFGLFGESLRKITDVIDFWRFFTHKAKSLQHQDYAALQKGYREKIFLAPIVNLSTSFLFANWFEISCDDEKAQEILNDFWSRHQLELVQAGIESGLFGDTYLAFEYDGNESRLMTKVLHPDSVKKMRNKMLPWILDGWKIKTKIDSTYIEETITKKKWQILVNQKKQGSLKGRNPYGILPIVHVTETRFSNEEHGTGEVSDALWNLLEEYARLLEMAGTTEKYHGSPIPLFKGIKDFAELKKKITTEKKWKPGMGLFMPKDADAEFLESKRRNDNVVALLKMLFWAIVIESETPEYLLGVHMKAAQASTKEQRVPVERKTERRRLVWTKALQQANRIILPMEEYHKNKKFKTYETDVEWGPIFEKDKKEDAEVMEKKTKAISTLCELEIISTETARENLSEIIDDPEKEKQRIEDERQASEEYPAPETEEKEE